MADDVRVTNFPKVDSAEEVAFKLLTMIGNAEGRDQYAGQGKAMTREWILRTYAQCLYTIKRAAYPDAGETGVELYKP